MLIQCPDPVGGAPLSPPNFRFKTVINLVGNEEEEERGARSGGVTVWRTGSGGAVDPLVEGRTGRFRVVVSVGGEVGVTIPIRLSGEERSSPPPTPLSSNLSPIANNEDGPFRRRRRRLKPLATPAPPISLRRAPSITFSSSSLYIRAAPPPVPKRKTCRRESLRAAAKGRLEAPIASFGEANANGEKIDDEDDRICPLKKPSVGVPGLKRLKGFSCTLSSQEYDLEQRIALEIKMREGTTKLLAACGTKGPQASQPHTLEAAKSLLTSNERMTAYMAELQRRRASKRPNLGNWSPCLARVCLSDLRMPLLWKDIEHFKNKGDNRKFAVFVLLKIGTEIYDTVMVNPVDRSMTDICFDDIIVFNGIPPNFECTVEVYSHLLESDMVMANIPRKLKKTLHSSISRTVGRKLAASLRDELATGDTGPKFELVASATLTLENISNNISTFDLSCSNGETRPDELPLFGHFCCRLAAQPDIAAQERISGLAKVPESGNPEPSWCRLYGWRLEVWDSKEDAETSPHHPLSLSVDKHTEVNQTSQTALQLSNNQGIDRGVLTLSFKTSEECSRWFKVVKQHVSDHDRWGKAAEEEMEILTPQPSRHSFAMPKRGRFTSLYEETPLRDGSPSSEKSSTDDLSESNFSFVNTYCTPAPMTPRTRAFTLSTRSSFRRWGSVRANMPFFKTKS